MVFSTPENNRFVLDFYKFSHLQPFFSFTKRKIAAWIRGVLIVVAMREPLTLTLKRQTPIHKTLRVRQKIPLKRRVIKGKQFSGLRAMRRAAQQRKSNRWASRASRSRSHLTLACRRQMLSRENLCWSSWVDLLRRTNRLCPRLCRLLGRRNREIFSFIDWWRCFRQTIDRCSRPTTPPR